MHLVRMAHPHWLSRWVLAACLPEYPEKVILAKCDRLISQGVLDGCTCGCRGDFKLPEGVG